MRFCTPIELDYAAMSVNVIWNGKRVKLNALTNAVECTLVTGPMLSSLIYQEIGNIEEIFVLDSGISTVDLPKELEPLLTEYADVFEDPIGSPPARGVEHQI